MNAIVNMAEMNARALTDDGLDEAARSAEGGVRTAAYDDSREIWTNVAAIFRLEQLRRSLRDQGITAEVRAYDGYQDGPTLGAWIGGKAVRVEYWPASDGLDPLYAVFTRGELFSTSENRVTVPADMIEAAR
jgi:hypothetical protein